MLPVRDFAIRSPSAAAEAGVEAVEKRPEPLSLLGLSGKIAISSPESCFRPRHASLQAVRHQSEFAIAD